jgi:hypothetical protein
VRRTGLWAACVVLILLVGAGVLTVGAGYANDEPTVAKCSEATLHGMYLVAQNGEFAGSQEPFAAAGYEVYDGNGKVKGVFSFNFNGDVAAKFPNNFRDDGTYTVKADCTGATIYKSGGVRYTTDLFIDPDGRMFTWVQTNPPERVTAGFELQGGPSESETEPLSLDGANMQGATGVTSQGLEQRVDSLDGAIMPDGLEHP